MMKKLLLLMVTLILTVTLAYPIGRFFVNLSDLPLIGVSSFIISGSSYNFFEGLVPSYILSLTLLYSAFGGLKKYKWMTILLTPALIVQLYIHPSYFYLPIIIGLIGWLLGLGINKLIYRNKNQTSIKDT